MRLPFGCVVAALAGLALAENDIGKSEACADSHRSTYNLPWYMA